MDAFWTKGYEATSVSDLCERMGLHKGSLYQTFGDKHALFMRALEHYAQKEFREVVAAASRSVSPLENLKAAVRKIRDDSGTDKGCLMINAVVELAPHDPEVKAALRRFGAQRLQAMTELIAQAQRAGEIRGGLDPYRLARQLMVTLAGSAAMVKGVLDDREIAETLDSLVESWT